MLFGEDGCGGDGVGGFGGGFGVGFFDIIFDGLCVNWFIVISWSRCIIEFVLILD